MWSVPLVPVHIAVLAVAKDGPPTQAVTEKATAAGHKVVARATVADAQNAIRTQLALWIDDPNIDVIIVSGGTESNAASGAVKPLVSEVLPGFTDLFRYLAFQEIGAGAMHSNAEAARCSMTFVFVLPAAEGAVRAAMDKLILPQLDANTTPKNLVSSMPRIQNIVEVSAIPAVIVKEKTAGGPGMASRMPAAATPPRGRPVTANTISRRQERSVDDPPTRPIDVAKLEQQIALSEAGSSPTKRVDLSRLPKVPPGADETLDDPEILEGQPPNGRHPRLESEPIAPPPPASGRVVQHTPTRGSAVVKEPASPAASSPASPRALESVASRSAGVSIAKPSSSPAPVAPPREIQHTPSRGMGVVAKVPTIPPPRNPPTVPPVPRRTTTEAVAVVPPARQSQPVVTRKPTDPPAIPERAKSQSGAPAIPERAKSQSGAPATPERAKSQSGAPAMPERAKSQSGAPATPERAKQPSGPVPTVASRAKQPSGPNPAVPPPPPKATGAASRTSDAAEARVKRPTDSAPLGTPTMAVPVVSAPDDLPLSMRSVELSRAASEGVSDPVAAIRLPPPRKHEPVDMAALISTPLSRGSDDLPLGEFHYPTKKSGKAGWILALLAMAALGFAAVVLIVPRLMSQGTASNQATPPPAVPEPPPVVAAAVIDAELAVAVTPDPEPIVEPDVPPTEPPPATNPTGKTNRSSKTKVPTTKETHSPTGTNGSKAAAGSGSAAEQVPDPEPPVAPPITASDCDEVACVLAKYNRPCCEKYRPASSDLKPRTAGGVPTELDKAAVRSAIEKVKPAVVACGEKNSEKGTVKIAMTVKPDGSVSDASVAASPDDALGSCVASALRKAQFAKTVNGGSFTYPFVF
jgi:molybdenum cofactor biosynthesis protein B